MGVDHNRTSLMAAVMEKKAGMRFVDMDIFVNIVGGVRVEEPALDLPLAVALASSLLDRPVPADTVVFGEVGLAGEVRGTGRAEPRLKEAAKMGFRRALIPKNNLDRTESKEMELTGVGSVREALDVLF